MDISQKVPAKVGLFLVGMPVICFNSSDALNDLYITKNAHFTKHEVMRDMERPQTKASMLRMDSDDPQYKKKRKAVSGAFLKSKMTMITNVVKRTILSAIQELQNKGDVNEIDLVKFTGLQQARVIIGILVGYEFCGKTIQYQEILTGEVHEVTIEAFMGNLFNDRMKRLSRNPLLLTRIVSSESEIMSSDRHYLRNTRELRKFIGEIIEVKKASKDLEPSDFVSILLKDENYQN